MVRKIDLLLPPHSEYGLLTYCTKELYEALLHQGAKARLLVSDRTNPKPFLESILGDPPECTLSFNGLLPDSQGNFFCDMIKIPHIACLTHEPTEFFPLTQSARNFIGCPDRHFVQFFVEMQFKQTFYFPHAVSKELAPNFDGEKKYDVVFFGTFVEHETLFNKYTKPIQKVLECVVQRALVDEVNSYATIIADEIDKQHGILDGFDPYQMNMIQVLDDIEQVIKGKSRLKMLRSIQNAKVHVFGSGWGDLFKDQKNVTLHGPVPFEQSLEILRSAKIALNTSCEMRAGVHCRVLTALSSGALPITTGNPIIDKDFPSLPTFQKSEEIEDLVASLLKSERQRKEKIVDSLPKILESYTFDARAKELMQLSL